MTKEEVIKELENEIDKIMADPKSRGSVEGCGTPEAEGKVWGLMKALRIVKQIE